MVYEKECKIFCDCGYWYLELPFKAGIIELGDSINNAIIFSDELKVIDDVENGVEEIETCEDKGWDMDYYQHIKEKLLNDANGNGGEQ